MADIDAGTSTAIRRRPRRRWLRAGIYITMMIIGLAMILGASARSAYHWAWSQESTAWIAPAVIAGAMCMSAVVSWAQGQLRREADRRRRRAAVQPQP